MPGWLRPSRHAGANEQSGSTGNRRLPLFARHSRRPLTHVLIGIDAREICGHPTGVGRYLNTLLLEWAALPAARNHRFILFAPEAPQELPSAEFEVQLIAGAGGTGWE